MLTPLALAAALACAAEDDAYVELDYESIPREIAKQPSYVAEPRYALFVFGPKGHARMWAVLDRSDAELEYQDVLYLDLDCDGDLTDAGERFQGTYDPDGEAAGVAMSIHVGDVPVPGTTLVHERFRLSTVRKKKRPGIWFQMWWNGEEEFSGGYAPVSPNLTEWGESPAEAPVLRPTPLGPFSYALYTWGGERVVLPRGESTKVYVMVGNAGSGPDTLSVVSEEFLDLDRDELRVTLIGRDGEGNELRTDPIRIRQHC